MKVKEVNMRSISIAIFVMIVLVDVVSTQGCGAVRTRTLSQTVQIDGEQKTFLINFSTSDFPASTTIASVIPSVTFWKIGGSNCNNIPSPAIQGPQNNELEIFLTHNLVQVSLIARQTFTAGAVSSSQLVSMTFDSLNPESLPLPASIGPQTGVFYPSGNLTAFNGDFVTGDWVLTVGDFAQSQVTCFYEFRLTINCAASQTFQFDSPTLPVPTIITSNALQLQTPSNGYQISVPYNTAGLPQVTIFDRLSQLIVSIPFYKYGAAQSTNCNLPLATSLSANPNLEALDLSLRFDTIEPTLVAQNSWTGSVGDTPPYTVSFDSSATTRTSTWVTGSFLPEGNFCELIGVNPIGDWFLLIRNNDPSGPLCFTTFRMTLDTCASPSLTPSVSPSTTNTVTVTSSPSPTSTNSITATPSASRTPSSDPSTTPTQSAARSNAANPTSLATGTPSNSVAATASRAASSTRTPPMALPALNPTPAATTAATVFNCESQQYLNDGNTVITHPQYFVINSFFSRQTSAGFVPSGVPVTLSSTCSGTICSNISPAMNNGLIFSNVRYYTTVIADDSGDYCCNGFDNNNNACFAGGFCRDHDRCLADTPSSGGVISGTFTIPKGTFFLDNQPGVFAIVIGTSNNAGQWQYDVSSTNLALTARFTIGAIESNGPNQDPMTPQFLRNKQVVVPAHPHF